MKELCDGKGVCIFVSPTLHQRPVSDFTLYKAQVAVIYLSARPLTWESYDRYTLLTKPSLLLGNVDTIA